MKLKEEFLQWSQDCKVIYSKIKNHENRLLQDWEYELYNLLCEVALYKYDELKPFIHRGFNKGFNRTGYYNKINKLSMKDWLSY